MVQKTIQAAGLLALGFVGGILGVFGYTGTPLSSAGAQSLAAANTCATDADTKSDDGDVYFLGCGGIF